jgi:EF hand
MDPMRLSSQLALAAALLASATSVQAQMRFRGMDQNNDGVITRAEWRGNDQSFRNQDWNGDGVLSGEEMRPGGRRQTMNQDWNRDGIVNNQDTQISQRFRGYDMDNDNRVTALEWPGDQRLFARLDANRDSYLTMQEYSNGAGFRLDSLGGPSYGFSGIDRNGDGWVTRNEWNMGSADFNRLDLNRDNRISRFEFEHDTGSYGSPAVDFSSIDTNRDGWIARREWRMGASEFERIDANNDNRISRFEYDTVGAATNDDVSSTRRSAAWRTGYDRGISEGRAAGREDYVRNHGWDLEGQRELERADSGYTPQVGSLSDYQAGYREGFRSAYPAGFYEARDNR